MNNNFEETNLDKIKPVPIGSRKSKITVDDIVDLRANAGDGHGIGASELLDTFPDILAAESLKKLVAALKEAKSRDREIVWLIGAHTIKCGLSSFINGLIDEKFITTVATTGSSVIHDLELAFFGKTSEYVEEELQAGRFGMAEETAAHFAAACDHAWESGTGLGTGQGSYLEAQEAPHRDVSVFHKAFFAGIPATVHISFGTDIVHQHPVFPAARAGELTMKDFRVLTRRVERLFDGGVVVLLGSAVVLPEVFLKAVSINYNLGHKPSGVTAAAFDMNLPYRARENVLARPFEGAGNSYAITGHHEIMLPLLYFLLTG